MMGDLGHGGADRANRGPTGYIEADGVLDIGLRLKTILAPVFDFRLTRETDTTVELYDRPAMANDWGADLLVSIHTNAAADPTAGGIETFYNLNGEWGSQFSAQAKAVATVVQEELVKATGLRNRGIKTKLVDRTDSPIYGMDYFAVIRRAKCPAIIVEAGFHSNLQEEALLKTTEFRQRIAEAIAIGLKKVYGEKEQTPIIRPTTATIEQAQAWARNRAATDTFISLAPLYWQFAPIRGGVDPAGAYAQAAKETAFGRFGGTIDESYRNPCGLKTGTGGANNDRSAHQRFGSWEQGITAHLDHLALYAGAPSYPRTITTDPRHFPWIAGTAATFEALGGKWAPSTDYGKSIVRDYLVPLLATPVPEEMPHAPASEEPLIVNLRAEKEQLRTEVETLRSENARLQKRIEAALQALSEAS